MAETDSQFLMYTMDKFLTRAADDLNIHVENSVVNDVREVANLNLNNKFVTPEEIAEILSKIRKDAVSDISSFTEYKNRKKDVKSEIEATQDEIRYILERKKNLDLQMKLIGDSGSTAYNNLLDESDTLQNQLNRLNFKLEELENTLWSLDKIPSAEKYFDDEYSKSIYLKKSFKM